MRQFLLGICCVLTMLMGTARSQFIVTVGNGDGLTTPIQVVAGQQAVVPVFVHFGTQLEVDTFDVSTFSSAFDFQPVGWGHDSTAFNLSSLSITPIVPGSSQDTPLLNPPPIFNFDTRFTTSFSPNFGMSTTPTHLFNMNFTVPMTAAEGVYSINLVTVPTPSNATYVSVVQEATNNPSGFYGILGAQGGESPQGAIVAFNGSISISAVPEPTSLALLGVLGVGGVAWRRGRRLLVKG